MHISAILLLSLVIPVLADDESSFSEPLAENWQRFNPLGIGTFDFSGGQCRVTCPTPPLAQAYVLGVPHALPRASFYAPTEFADVVASVDLTAWIPTTNRSSNGMFIGLLTRIQTPVASDSVNGYGLSLIDMTNGIGRLQIFRLTNEFTTVSIAGSADFPLNTLHRYRLLLSSRGEVHTGRVFDLSAPSAPIAQLVGYDATFTSGRTGVSISTDRFAPVDATFDNFLTWDGTPPQLAIRPGAVSGSIELSCDLRRAMASTLESSTDPAGIEDLWQNAWPLGEAQSGEKLECVFPIDGPSRFFRRKRL